MSGIELSAQMFSKKNRKKWTGGTG